jgi:hypothetical protein
MTQKILVTGYAHCGTTILRAKVGECKNTYEQNGEFSQASEYNSNMPFDFYVWKHPFLHPEFRNNGFSIKPNTTLSDTIIIPIIRNPWNVFTSLYTKSKYEKSFSIYDNTHGYSLSYYTNAAEVIYDAMQKNYEGIYPIKYEDMFDDNFKALKNIFDKIGLQYNESVFLNKTKNYKFNGMGEYDTYDSLPTYNEFKQYRAWQINQPFENMNKNVDLPDDFSKMLENSEIINKLGYSDPRITV